MGSILGCLSQVMYMGEKSLQPSNGTTRWNFCLAISLPARRPPFWRQNPRLRLVKPPSPSAIGEEQKFNLVVPLLGCSDREQKYLAKRCYLFRFVLYLVGTAMISCLIITFIVTLGMGIGLGYNYCFVDMKTKYKYVPGRYIYPASEKPEELEDASYDATTDEDAKQNQTSSDNKKMRAVINTVAYDNQTEINEQPVSSDAKSINGTPSLEDVILDAVTKYDETTKASQNIPETNGSASKGRSLRFCTVARTTSKTPDMLYDSDVPTPEPELEPTQDLQTSNRIVKKLVIPISGLDLISLLTKLKAENNNYSLQLVTT